MQTQEEGVGVKLLSFFVRAGDRLRDRGYCTSNTLEANERNNYHPCVFGLVKRLSNPVDTKR